uniref:Uncharacterized protein n=1 Tax=Rhodosorus marinus TaxID=101924 RepID=A0A7S2ZE90_9RHOD|mmetsp:Transcript_16517/g.67847  ORF Transcript_16517/g.67847 Transcript_16517/m.67847 type:complete len:459 (+) Transcript_16517:127-1503(+)
MALLPPTLLAGVLTMFVLSRLRGIIRPFERWYYGIPYLVEPSQEHIKRSLEKSMGSDAGRSSAKENRKKKKNSVKDAQRIVPMVMKNIDQHFFRIVERKFMYEYDQVLIVFTAFLVVWSVEVILRVFTQFEVMETAHHLALGCIITCLGSLGSLVVHLGFGSNEGIAAAVVVILSILTALLATAPSTSNLILDLNVEEGIRFGQSSLEDWMKANELLETTRISRDIGRLIRIGLALLCGLSSAAVLLPSQRFSHWFFKFYINEQEDEDDEESASSGSVTKAVVLRKVTFFALCVDAVLPLAVSLLFFKPLVAEFPTSELAQGQLRVFRLVLLIFSCLLRLSLFRVRMRDYLSTGLEQAQKLLSGEGPVNAVLLEQRIFTIHFYLPAIGLQYIAPPLMTMASSMVALKSNAMPNDPLLFSSFQMFACWSSLSWGALYMVGLIGDRLTEVLLPESRLKKG